MSRLVLDVDDWTEAGEQLLEADPTRFAAILEVVREINAIHVDPFVKFPPKLTLVPALGRTGGGV